MMRSTGTGGAAIALVIGVCSGVCLPGCRGPWNLQRGQQPDFRKLIEIEQRQDSGHAAAKRSVPAAAQSKPAASDAASVPPASSADQPTGAAKLSPEEQLLERISRAIHGPDDRDAESAPTSRVVAASATSKPSNSATTDDTPEGTEFHLSDSSSAPDDRPRNRYIEPPADSRSASASASAPAGTALASSRKPDNVDASRDAAANPGSAPTNEADGSTPAVVPASATKSAPVPSGLASASIRELAYELIHKLESAAGESTNPDEQLDLAKKRRLINLVLDDLDGALEPIEGLQPEASDYIANTFQALYDATDLSGNPVANRRWTLALQSHRAAEQSLAKLANLEVKNLAFCTEVLSYGVTTKFSQYHFRPDQEVLLYCELSNFVSQPVRGGYETQLQGSYEIVDAQGRRVADQILPEDTDFCGNLREDFYVAYRFYLPSKLEPGRHELRLTIEDMKGHKFGQGKIDFHVVR